METESILEFQVRIGDIQDFENNPAFPYFDKIQSRRVLKS